MDYQAAYNRVVPVVEGKYGVEVMISDVVDPNTGDFDGQTILLGLVERGVRLSQETLWGTPARRILPWD